MKAEKWKKIGGISRLYFLIEKIIEDMPCTGSVTACSNVPVPHLCQSLTGHIKI